MTARDLSHSDFAGLEQSHAQRLATRMFADREPVYVEIHPVSPINDFLMNASVFLLAVAPVAIVLYFALS